MLGVIAALALVFTPQMALAAPTQDDIDAAREDERLAELSVAQIEVRLAAVRADLQQARIESALAGEALVAAKENLDEATEAAEKAQAEADEAMAKFEDARSELATVAQSAFRGGSGALDPLAPYLTSDGLQSVESRRNIIDSFGSAADSKLQNVAALEQVANVMAESAKKAKAAEEKAYSNVEAKTKAAEEKLSAAQALESDTELQSEALLAELAAKQNTTVELIRERDAAQQAEREAAERQAAIERSEQQTGGGGGSAPAPSQPGNGGGGGGTTTPPPAPPVTPPPSKPDPIPTPPPSTGGGGIDTVIAVAKSLLGAPYVWGGTGPGYDCSGLVVTAYAAIGVYLPRVSSQQWGATSRVSVGNAIPGDLIFWSSNGSQSGIYHVAIYLGGGQIIEAADYGIPLRITSIYNWGNVLGAGRVI